jgi:exonuclease III
MMEFLRADLKADLALLQEATAVRSLPGETILTARFPQQAGLAIYARGHKLDYHPADERLSSVARSKVLSGITTLGDSSLVVVNIHQPTRAKRGERRILVLHELQPVFEAAIGVAGSMPMIIGGDLNASVMFDDTDPVPGYPEYSHRAWFERMHAGQLFNARIPFSEAEVRTWRGRSRHQYQDDHLFVSRGLATGLRDWQIRADFPEEWTDHCPVVCDLDP